MPDVKALEAAVPTLPPTALAEFREWFAEIDSTAWNLQLEADRNAGKFDRLLGEHLALLRRSVSRRTQPEVLATDDGYAGSPSYPPVGSVWLLGGAPTIAGLVVVSSDRPWHSKRARSGSDQVR